ncbi:MAG TPA: DNA methyltransferase [Gammaproteobacteria bacterium]|nr:DNA methyltransferase [Gammaproteobacteria bacterium]
MAVTKEVHEAFIPLKSGAAIEYDFPIVEVSRVAEQESWRKEINRPLYHIHKWWATRLGTVFRAITLATLNSKDRSVWQSFYEYHNLSGKVVLDPFMGSGTTLGESLKVGAKVIGCDINPISTFLVNQALTRVSEQELWQAFKSLEEKIASEIKYYYQTKDPETREVIPVLYFFWVKTLTTPEGEEIPLFSRYVFAQDAYPKKKPLAKIVCSSCWEIFQDRYDSTSLKCPSCSHQFNPQSGPVKGQYVLDANGKKHRIKDLIPNNIAPKHRLYALLALRKNGEKIYLPPKQEDLDLFIKAELRLQEENLPLPTLPVRSGHNTDQARNYNYLYWKDFFNSRQLLCLGMLLKEILLISEKAIREQMLCLFSSTLEFNNLFCSYKGEGTGAVRHMFSNHILKPERTPLENSIWGTEKSSGTFCSLFKSRLLKAKRYLDKPFDLILNKDLLGKSNGSVKIQASEPINVSLAVSWDELNKVEKGALILNGDSSVLPLPDKVVDAIITDPPYFDFVHYSELSDFFFAWLSPVLKEYYPWFAKNNSSNSGEVQHDDPRIFASQLASVLKESHRVLKDDGTLAFSFHHSKEDGWAGIYEAINKAGFEVVAAHPVYAELRGANPKASTKDPISIDAILVCKKYKQCKEVEINFDNVIDRTEILVKKLLNGGIKISNSDRFVIAASQALISASAMVLEFDNVKSILQKIRFKLGGQNAL